MRYGKTLRKSYYGPWQNKYIDYEKLKNLLREDSADDDDDKPWTEEEENRFSDEVFNVQLEKVAHFQQEQVNLLRDRVDAAMDKLKELTPPEASGDGHESSKDAEKERATAEQLKTLESELDDITNQLNELKRYSQVNYTGFLKIVKKHDRKRGGMYKMRPIMQLSLSQRPFNSEKGYSPLVNKLSYIYFAIRQRLDGKNAGVPALPVSSGDSPIEVQQGEQYTAHKFWVHPDDLIEVKTHIMRHLPALVYSEQMTAQADANEDLTLTSLYFDDPKFRLYNGKIEREKAASSLRLRWIGDLTSKPDIMLEQKTVHDDGLSEELRVPIKAKYIKPFLDGEYHMEKTVQKMRRQGQSDEDIAAFESNVAKIQAFLHTSKLQPVVRANYHRSAFQKPGSDRVRICLDTDLIFVREDALDADRPCRDPANWHRAEIDDNQMRYPFKTINQSEVSRFPYAVLDIKLKEDGGRKRPTWIEDLMASHLVHPAPRFSKFVHGVASLFEDYVNRLPFWLSDLERDIRRDPQTAFDEEEERRARQAENELVVGSFLGRHESAASLSNFNNKQSVTSTRAYSHRSDQALAHAVAASVSRRSDAAESQRENHGVNDDGTGEGPGESSGGVGGAGADFGPPWNYGTISFSLKTPSFSVSKYARAKRAHDENPLPTGVVEPTEWLKNSGPLRVEPKVWLANERAFIKWQHIAILLGSLAISLYTAAGENLLAGLMGVLFLAVAVFAGAWGYYMCYTRQEMIMQRMGKHFDNWTGPIIVSLALMAALILNFAFAYRNALKRWEVEELLDLQQHNTNTTNTQYVSDELKFV